MVRLKQNLSIAAVETIPGTISGSRGIYVDPDFKIDSRWPDYREPTSAVSALLQQPSTAINAESLATAYMKDWRSSRRALKEKP